MGGFPERYEALVAELTNLAVKYGLNVIGAALILITGWIVANWARNTTRRTLGRFERFDATVKSLIAGTVRYLVLALTLLLVLGQFGVQTASIIAMLGAAGLAVGLALQGTLSNVAAGLMLLFLRPFKAGDYIEAGAIKGTVDEIGLFVSEFRTLDGKYMAVPNQKLWESEVVNWSRLPTRRVDVIVGISYDDDINKALTAITDEVAKDERILSDPAPLVAVAALAESSVNLLCRVWAKGSDAWPVTLDLNKRLKQRMDAEGIEIPFPQRTLHLTREGSGIAVLPQEARPA